MQTNHNEVILPAEGRTFRPAAGIRQFLADSRASGQASSRMCNRPGKRLFGLICRGMPVVMLGIVTACGCLTPAAMAADEPGIGAVISERLQKRLADGLLQPGAASTVVTVILHTNKPDTVQTAVQARGGKVRYRYHDMTEIEVPLGRLAQLLSALPGGTVARLPYPHTNGSITGQGVAVTGAGDMQSLGNNGAGIKAGVIDLGFTSYASAQASGDLPATLTIVDYTDTGTGGTSHGTNVAEIVHDMAPGAELYLAKIGSTTQVAAAVTDMIAAGVSVIVHSVSWFGAAYYDGSGPLCDIVNDAEAGGIVWANAIGNSRNKHYDAVFGDTNSDLRHEFSPGQDYNTIALNANQAASLILSWDAYPSTSIDYDLYLYDGDPAAGGSVVASSTNRQSANGRFHFPQPYEAIDYTAPASATYYITVQKVNGSQPDVPFTLHSLVQSLSVRVQARSLTQPGDCPNALGVGATRVSDDVPEGFSSEGPNKAGLDKPDISAPDRVQTSLSSSFAGTSAAAPHVAGAVALLQAANPGISTTTVRNLLMDTAHDVHTPGFDFRTGPGRVSLDADVDGLNHDDEAVYGTDPLDEDWDNDGLLDGEEVNTYNTLPKDSDTDDDGASDGEEVSAGTDPRDPDDYPAPAADGNVAPRFNIDNAVNAADYLLMQRFVLGLETPTTGEEARGDINGNGVIDLPDLILLLNEIMPAP